MPQPRARFLRLSRDPSRLEELSPAAPRAEGYVRFVCVSDTHQQTGRLRLPGGDVLVHAGDFTNTGHREQIERFSSWLASCDFPQKIVIAGNHELSFDRSFMAGYSYGNLGLDPDQDVISLLGNSTYLQDTAAVVKGFKVYGSPWQPAFCNWAFNLTERRELREKWEQIPSDTDILVTHGPPHGICDLVPGYGNVGCSELSEAVERVRPMVHVFGHIHEGYGHHFDGRTLSINAALCDRALRPVNGPVVVDLPLPQSRR